MFADIPPIFKDDCVAPGNEWICGTDIKFYMHWYGLPAKITKGVLFKWNGAWVECEEKKDIEYTDARICSSSVSYFNPDGKLEDGLYYLVGLNRDNPYGFKLPMLIPFDTFTVNYSGPITVDSFKSFLLFHPNTFGVMASNGDKWAYVTGHDVGLSWNYDRDSSMPTVQQDSTPQAE